MTEPCVCLKCALAKLLDERFPNGFDADETIAALTAIASVSGWLLSAGGEQSLKTFFDLVRSERDVQREAKPASGGRLH